MGRSKLGRSHEQHYYGGEGNRATTYVHDAFGVLAAEYSSTAITPACVTCYLVYDHLGSVRLVTDQASNVVARHEYLLYGQEIPNGTAGRSGNGFGVTGNVNQMFTGQERDPEMTPNTDFFNARYFASQTSVTFNGQTETYPVRVKAVSPIAPWTGTNALEGYSSGLGLLFNFSTGTGSTNRRYTSFSPESLDLERSSGFGSALQKACSSGQSSGDFNLDSGIAALNLPHDVVTSFTGAQVGGYWNSSYSWVDSDTRHIHIYNDAGAKSFFYHLAKNRSSSTGPFRTINQQFDINLVNPCGK